MRTSRLATRLEKIRPKTGVPRTDSAAKGCGNSLSRAAACANWPDISTQPLSAPKQETIATVAMRLPDHPPQMTFAASANGALELASEPAGTHPPPTRV